MAKNRISLEKDKKKKIPFNVFSKKSLAALALAGAMMVSPFMVTGCSNGQDGKDGKDGANVPQWYYSTVDVVDGALSGNVDFTAVNGDFYIDTDNYILYQLKNGSWTTVMENYGRPGTPGQNGATWLTGTAITGTGTGISATIANSKDGDLYFNTDTCDIYQCTAENTWNWIANIKGEKGEDGLSITNVTTNYETDYITQKEYIVFTFEFSQGEPKVIKVEIPAKVSSMELDENTFTQCEVGGEPTLQLSVVYDNDTTETIDVTNEMFVVEGDYVKPNFTKSGTYSVKIIYKNKNIIRDIIVNKPTTTIPVDSANGTLQTVTIVDNLEDMVYRVKSNVDSTGAFIMTQAGRSCSYTTILKVNGGETLTPNQYLEGRTFDWSVCEFTGLPLSSSTANTNGLTANKWVIGVMGQDSYTLHEDTRYIMITFKNGDGTTEFSDADTKVLPYCLNISNTKDAELTTVLANKGITNVSVLGDSISTFEGVSNNTDNNSTTGSNAVYYGGTGNTGSSIITDVNDTWWMQTINDLGLDLLVNNSYSGDKCVEKGLTRAVQLHDDNGDREGTNPDIIAVAMGINDFNWSTVTVSTFETTYDAMISAMVTKYTDADIFLFTLFPNGRRSDVTEIEKFNEVIRNVAKKYNVDLVDIYSNSGLTIDTYANFTDGDGAVHPNAAGMDIITKCFKNALYEKYIVNDD